MENFQRKNELHFNLTKHPPTPLVLKHKKKHKHSTHKIIFPQKGMVATRRQDEMLRRKNLAPPPRPRTLFQIRQGRQRYFQLGSGKKSNLENR